MKPLFAILLCCVVSTFGAVPSYDKFFGTGGIIVTTNPPNGTVVIDGSSVVGSGAGIRISTNATTVTAAATNINFTPGNNAVLKGTNIDSAAHLNIGIASNLTFNTGLGPVVVGSWGDVWGISNVSLQELAMWLPEVDSSSEAHFRNSVIVGGIMQASNVTLTAIPGTGTNVGITAGGTLFRMTVTGGSGTPGGENQSIQFNTNGAFGGDTSLQYEYPVGGGDPFSGRIKINQGGKTNAMDSHGFGTDTAHDVWFRTAGLPKWYLKSAGHWNPTANGAYDIGSGALLPRTNFQTYFWMPTGAERNRQLRSVATHGEGVWGNPQAGGNGNIAGGADPSPGAIQFGQTNVAGLHMMLDSTNNLVYWRNVNELAVTNTGGTSNTVIGAGYIRMQLLQAETLYVNSVVSSNGFPAFGSSGWVQYADNGTNKAEAAFSYDDGDDTLTLTSLVAQTIAILPNAGAGKVLTDVSGTGVGTWQLPAGGDGSRLTNITAWTEDFSSAYTGRWAVESNGVWNVNGGVLCITNGTGVFGNFLKRTNWLTCFQDWTMTCTVTPYSIDTVSYGLAFGIRSPNAYGDSMAALTHGFYAGVASSSWYVGPSYNPTQYNASLAALNPAVASGEPLDVTVKRRGHIWSISSSNTVTGAQLDFQHTAGTLVQANGGWEPSSGYFLIWSLGGTQTVDNITFKLDVFKPTTLCVGDSITGLGLGATTIAQTWPNLLRTRLNDPGVQIFGNSSDYIGLTLLGLPEYNLIQPHNTIVMLGGNDVVFGVAAATWKANYITLVSTMTNTGSIYHCLPTPRTSTDLTQLALFLSTNYARSTLIDTWNGLKSLTTTLRADYSYDGTHLNSAGAAAVSEAVENKLRGR